MSAKDRQRFYLSVRKEALRAARSWDLSPQTIEAIRTAKSSSTTDYTIASLNFADAIVGAQLLAVFVYATVLLGGSCSYSSDEDVHVSGGRIMMLEISGREGGAR